MAMDLLPESRQLTSQLHECWASLAEQDFHIRVVDRLQMEQVQ